MPLRTYIGFRIDCLSYDSGEIFSENPDFVWTASLCL